MIKRAIQQSIKNGISSFLYHGCVRRANTFYSNAIKYNPILKEPAKHEELWLKKWRVYDSKLSPLAYRVFSRYIGEDLNIVPLEICSGICEQALLPDRFRNDIYSDKNFFDILFPQGTLPQTFLRKIRNNYYDKSFNIIPRNKINDFLNDLNCANLIIKPSLSESGVGVVKFSNINGVYMNNERTVLTIDYLEKNFDYGCIVQESFQQHEFFSNFNPTSVNTIRIASYRTPDGTIKILNSIIRIGSKGSVVDNAHAGGKFIGVKPNGTLCNQLCDQFGRTQAVFNDIDFSQHNFVVPNWDLIQQKVIELSKYVIHHDLMAWDVILDTEGNPHIIELNIGGFSGWLFQFTSGPMFGDYADLIMKSAIKRLYKTAKLKILFIRDI